MNRAFGQQFQYLDYEWLQDGDYESVYLPMSELPLTPPEGLSTEPYYLTTAINDGIEWEPYSTTVQVGFDGDDMWLQGICKYLPEAWIKGTREGNTVTFANTQLLGSYEVLLYFKAADYNPINGNTTQQDMVLTIDDDGSTFYTYDYAFITTDKNELSFLNYYQGLTLAKQADSTATVPEGLKTHAYTFTFRTLDEYGSLVNQQQTVAIGFAGDRVFIQGLCSFLPESWVEGRLVNGQLTLELPQYLGTYSEEYQLTYPIYLNGFSQETGLLNRRVTLDYDAQTSVFSNPSTPFGFGINKTGYLNVQDCYEARLEPVERFLTGDVNDDGQVNISDVILLINYIVSGDASGINLAAADVDYNNQHNISDVIALINIVLNG
jgi:hypothetical protein